MSQLNTLANNEDVP